MSQERGKFILMAVLSIGAVLTATFFSDAAEATQLNPGITGFFVKESQQPPVSEGTQLNPGIAQFEVLTDDAA